MKRGFPLAILLTALAACAPGTPADPGTGDPTEVMLSPGDFSLAAPGDTRQLGVLVLDQAGQVMTDVTVSWTTSAAGIATVSTSGLVTAVADGSATIRATAGSASDSLVVTVGPTP